MGNIVAIPEILTAMLEPHLVDTQSFKSAPRDYLSSHYSVELAHDLNVVENTSAEMHLCLPYYSEVSKLGPSGLDDIAMAKVAGGFTDHADGNLYRAFVALGGFAQNNFNVK